MSNTAAGYNSQNGEGKPPCSNGPIQNPVMTQAPGQGYNTAAETMHPQHMPAKAPLEQPAGQYHYGCYQSGASCGVYQGPGQALLLWRVSGTWSGAPPVACIRDLVRALLLWRVSGTWSGAPPVACIRDLVRRSSSLACIRDLVKPT
ncbi:protein transport protein Sec24A isoform X1 [Huso huso]|uniref:Protein transport protein Sec24A isoform X1 n=1 Tax=Huso huso TaxID=61971 RepID=A0ABR0YSZ7_HUSHU